MLTKYLNYEKTRNRKWVFLISVMLIFFITACSGQKSENDLKKEAGIDSMPIPELPDELNAGLQPEPRSYAEVEENKKIAFKFLHMSLNEHNITGAFEKYIAPDFIQHDQWMEAGTQPTIEYFNAFHKENPRAFTEIKRVIGEGNMVVIHHNSRNNPMDLGLATIDIFRIENEKIVEHWNSMQAVLEKSKNENAVF